LTSGLEVLLKGNVPFVGLRGALEFNSKPTQTRLSQAINRVTGKRLFSLSHTRHLQEAVETITQRGLGVGEIMFLDIPFYSSGTVFRMAMIEVLPSRGEPPPLTWSKGVRALEPQGFRAAITGMDLPSVLTSGLNTTVHVKVKNTSDVTWPALGQVGGAYRVTFGNHWLDRNGNPVSTEESRVELPYDLTPDSEVELALTIRAPRHHGEYLLELDLVQDGVAWFKSKGSAPARVLIDVE
jgi:hypothetical protein